MLRFVGLLMLLVLSFGFGYLSGKQPMNNLEQTVRDFSKNVVDTTLGIERDLHRRQNLVQAKSSIVQAKAELFSKNTNDAAKELAEAASSLELVAHGGKQVNPNIQIKELAEKIREIRTELTVGRKVSATKLDEVQKELDLLLRQ